MSTALAAAALAADNIIAWEISIGQIVTWAIMFVSFTVTIVGLYYGLRGSIDRGQAAAMVAAEGLNEKFNTLGGRMINIEMETKEIAKALNTLAVQEERIATLARRIDNVDTRMLGYEQELRNRRERRLED